MSHRILTTTALAMLLGLAAAPLRAAEWVCSGYMPSAQHATIMGLQAIGNELTRLTGGDITTTCKAGGELSIAATELTAATSDGVVQLASNAFITGAVPIVGLFALPGLFTTEDELAKGLAIAEPVIAAALDKQGLVYLGTYHYPRQVIWSTGPFDKLADMAGKKFRVSSGEQAEFVTRFGGTPVTLGSSDVAQALQLGTISGVMTAASGGARYWTDILKANYELGPNFTVSPVFANKDAFEALTPDQQAQLRDFAAKEVVKISASMAKENGELLAQFKTRGMTVTPANAADEAALVAKLADYWPQWARQRGAEAEATLGQIRSALGK